ncbi:MAG: hypothetical protein QM754_02630 [Tepidisphaeraceae bacterium]
MANGAVQAAITSAWNASNPNGDIEDKLEQGFGVYYSLADGSLSITVTTRDPNAPTNTLPRPAAAPEGKILVAVFHTHPFTAADGYDLDPSPADIDLADDSGLVEFLKNHNGIVQYGAPFIEARG